MKINKLTVLLILIIVQISGCRKNNDDWYNRDWNEGSFRVKSTDFVKDARLKQISFGLINNKKSYVKSEYTYDSSGRISSISHPMYENDIITGVISHTSNMNIIVQEELSVFSSSQSSILIYEYF